MWLFRLEDLFAAYYFYGNSLVLMAVVHIHTYLFQCKVLSQPFPHTLSHFIYGLLSFSINY